MSAAASPFGFVGQGVRYLISGGLAALVDLALFAAIHPEPVSALWLAAAMSFAVAAAFNYVVSSRFVFLTPVLSLRRSLLFLVMSTCGLLINAGVTSAVVAVAAIAPVLAKIVGIGTAFVCNFLMNRYIVFAVARR